MQPVTMPPELADEPAPKPPAPRPVLSQPLQNARALRQKLARRAQMRSRHNMIVVSFLAFVALPALLSAFYLFAIAKDQFASRVGFSIRSEEGSNPLDLLGGIADFSGGGANDADILYDFISSQNMVRQIDAKLELRKIWALAGDPVFTLARDPTIEELRDFWNGKVQIYYDTASGLIEVRVLAFDPLSAQKLAQAIFDESSATIDTLSRIASADATKFARAEFERAEQSLKDIRSEIQRLRRTNQMVDPTADFAGQMGVLNSLQAQLAEAMIAFDLLKGGRTRRDDPRVDEAERRIEITRSLIEAERAKFGHGTQGAALADVIADYERLRIDQEFAEQSLFAARAALQSALSDAQRKSKYLAAHIPPTRAEAAEYPQRLILLSVLVAGLFFLWAIGVLIYYSVRDRR